MKRAASTEGTLSALIESIYAASIDPSLWTGFLESLANLTGTEVACFLLHDLRAHTGSVMWQFGTAPELMAEYDAWAPKNIYMRAAAPRVRTGIVVNAQDFVADRVARESEYFNEYLKRVGVLHNLGAAVFHEQSLACGLMLLRQIGRPSHGSRDLALVRTLVPHLQRAIEVHRRLVGVDLARAAAEEVLDRMSIGIVLLDHEGTTLFLNHSAREKLDQNDGLSLDRSGRLTARRPAESARLQALVAGACAAGTAATRLPGGALAVSRPSGRRPFAIFVAPVRPAAFAIASRLPVAVLFVSDPERDVVGVERILQQLYKLTPAEAKVGVLLLEGRRVDEIRQMLEVSESTARTHVRRILDKTAAKGQGDLIRMLVSGPAGAVLERAGRASGKA